MISMTSRYIQMIENLRCPLFSRHDQPAPFSGRRRAVAKASAAGCQHWASSCPTWHSPCDRRHNSFRAVGIAQFLDENRRPRAAEAFRAFPFGFDCRLTWRSPRRLRVKLYFFIFYKIYNVVCHPGLHKASVSPGPGSMEERLCHVTWRKTFCIACDDYSDIFKQNLRNIQRKLHIAYTMLPTLACHSLPVVQNGSLFHGKFFMEKKPCRNSRHSPCVEMSSIWLSVSSSAAHSARSSGRWFSGLLLMPALGVLIGGIHFNDLKLVINSSSGHRAMASDFCRK